MKSKLIQLRNSFTRVLLKREYGNQAPRCDAHMNELPIPCQPWEPWYKEKQSYYLKCLILGILWHGFSLFMAIYTESLFFNWGPPAQPGPPSDMVEECDDADS